MNRETEKYIEFNKLATYVDYSKIICKDLSLFVELLSKNYIQQLLETATFRLKVDTFWFFFFSLSLIRRICK